MKPDFALDLSSEGIVLLHRVNRGWRVVGETAVDGAGMKRRLAELRQAALELRPEGIWTKLILPSSQVLYTSIACPSRDEKGRRAAIEDALDGVTPYDLHELAYDWEAEGEVLHIAVVARETLQEAEAFAVEHAFNPVSIVARPKGGSFTGEPFFGATAFASETLVNGQRVERDVLPTVVTLRLTAPIAVRAGPKVADEAAAAPGPDEATAGEPLDAAADEALAAALGDAVTDAEADTGSVAADADAVETDAADPGAAEADAGAAMSPAAPEAAVGEPGTALVEAPEAAAAGPGSEAFEGPETVGTAAGADVPEARDAAVEEPGTEAATGLADAAPTGDAAAEEEPAGTSDPDAETGQEGGPAAIAALAEPPAVPGSPPVDEDPTAIVAPNAQEAAEKPPPAAGRAGAPPDDPAPSLASAAPPVETTEDLALAEALGLDPAASGLPARPLFSSRRRAEAAEIAALAARTGVAGPPEVTPLPDDPEEAPFVEAVDEGDPESAPTWAGIVAAPAPAPVEALPDEAVRKPGEAAADTDLPPVPAEAQAAAATIGPEPASEPEPEGAAAARSEPAEKIVAAGLAAATEDEASADPRGTPETAAGGDAPVPDGAAAPGDGPLQVAARAGSGPDTPDRGMASEPDTPRKVGIAAGILAAAWRYGADRKPETGAAEAAERPSTAGAQNVVPLPSRPVSFPVGVTSPELPPREAAPPPAFAAKPLHAPARGPRTRPHSKAPAALRKVLARPRPQAAGAEGGEAQNVFGASRARRERSPLVGFVLTAGLVAFLAAVALWSAFFGVGSSPELPDLAAAPAVGSAEATVAAPVEDTAPPADVEIPEPETDLAALPPAPVEAPLQPAAPAAPSDTGAAGVAAETPPAGTSAPATAGMPPGEAGPDSPQDLAVAYAATGIWSQPPEPPAAVTEGVLGDPVAPALDPRLPEAQLAALPDAADAPDGPIVPGEAAPQAEGPAAAPQAAPAPPAAAALAPASPAAPVPGPTAIPPQGATDPEAVVVIDGRPPVVPPGRTVTDEPAVAESPVPAGPTVRPRPRVAPVGPAAAPAEENPLAGFRPRPRDADAAPAAAPPGDAALLPEAAEPAGAPATPAPAAPPFEADPALAEFRPVPRPQALAARLASEAASRAAAEAAAAAVAEAVAQPEEPPPSFAGATEYAVASALIPRARPGGFADRAGRQREAVAAAAAVAPEQAPSTDAEAEADGETVQVAAAPAPRDSAPQLPSRASVARQATVENAIRLNQINLIGIYGSASDRRALIRLSSGRYVKVQVGDRVDGGRVQAISDRELSYSKNGRNHILRVGG